MIYIALGLTILEGITLALWQQDRKHCLNALIARSPQEFRKLERSETRELKKIVPDSDERPFV